MKEKNTQPKKVGPIAMPAVGRTYNFPRLDNVFLHKESNAYDESMT